LIQPFNWNPFQTPVQGPDVNQLLNKIWKDINS